MRALLGKARTRLGVAVIGAAVLAVGGTATAAGLVQPTSSSGDVFEAPEGTTASTTEATSPAAETTSEATPAPVPADTPAATVGDVTEPQPEPAPVVEPTVTEAPAPAPVQPSSGYDPTAPFEQGGMTYIPAPPPPPEPTPPTQPPMG